MCYWRWSQVKINEVPQEGNNTHPGEHKAIYALDENGEYRLVPSAGWKVEEMFTTVAIDDMKKQTELAYSRVKDGVSSPLEYHMYKNRMDLVVLSQATGFFKWRIKRHFDPERFKKLSNKILNVYADAMGIPIEELKEIPETTRD
jgi:uncharacterized membrane protein